MESRPRIEDIFVPKGTRILVKQTITERIGVIFLPQKGQMGEKEEGTIVAVGKDVDENVYGIKKGMYVLYGKYAGVTFNYEREKFQLMDASDVLAEIIDDATWNESHGIKREPMDMIGRTYEK